MERKGKDAENIWSRISALEVRVKEVDRRLAKLEDAVYGDDSGIISRLAVIEARIDSVNGRIQFLTIISTGIFISIIALLVKVILGGG